MDGTVHAEADLDRRRAQFAIALVARGLKPGDRVARQVEKSVEAVFGYLGTSAPAASSRR